MDHREGEAQLDFGVMEAVQNGEIIDVNASVLSFPASHTAFAVPIQRKFRILFSALQMLFKQTDGVPLSIRIDNLTPAVKSKKR